MNSLHSPRERIVLAAARYCGLTLLAATLAAFAAGCQKEEDGSYTLKSNKPSSKDLVAMVLDPSDPDRRREGIMGLSQHPHGMDPTALKLYAVVASNPKEDVTVRSIAVGALGRSGNAQYAPEMLACLNDPDPSLRWDAAVALDNIVAPAAVESLRNHALADPIVDVRACSAKALRHYRQSDVVATLQRCLTDRDYSVRHQAHGALVEIAGYDKGFDLYEWNDLANDLRKQSATTAAAK